MSEHRKKLIETALPLAAINKASAREKSIRHGHPSTLHLWWARRPLAACRAVLFAQLVDDPSSDPRYRIGDKIDEEAAAAKRAELFNLIEALVQWENTNNPQVINAARAEIARCGASRLIASGKLQKETIIFGKDEGKNHPGGAMFGSGRTAYDMILRRCRPEAVNHFLATYMPPVLDPFAGGGSIPLEAQRLGLRAHASDLNPVAVLINKALIEIPPKFAGLPPVNPDWQDESEDKKSIRVWEGAQGLAEDVRYYGAWVREQAEQRIGHLYPKAAITQEMIDAGRDDLKPYLGRKLTVIAWLWARTIQCPNPACGNRMPMLRSFWLSKKKGKEVYAKPVINESAGVVTFVPTFEKDAPPHTSDRTGARCLFCDQFIKKTQLRELACNHGVAEIPLAIVAEGDNGRVYLPFSEDHVPTIQKPDVPALNQNITNDKRWFSPPLYGLRQFKDIFTARQLTALITFSDLVQEARSEVMRNAKKSKSHSDKEYPFSKGGTGYAAYADVISLYIGFGLSRAADAWSSIVSWRITAEATRGTFARQALPIVWDYAEANPFSSSCGNWNNACMEWVVKSLKDVPANVKSKVKQLNATMDVTYDGEIITTDPPYYDNIGYADLSDFFYLWLRRTLSHVFPEILSTMLTPKTEELIASPYRNSGSKKKASKFFEKGLGKAIKHWRMCGHPNYPITIFYAFKQAETDAQGTASTGWETFLNGIINSGFTITGTWPIRTERSVRSVAIGTNALASSVVLSCVPRASNAPIAARRDFLSALKRELPKALDTLQSGNIAPVDLAQAAIGPGMAIFSRYAKVLESDGSPMTVRAALILINQALDEALAEQEGDFDADTRWCIAWFQQYGMNDGEFGTAETLSKAKNTSVSRLADAGVIAARSGKVRLIPSDQMPDGQNPATDPHISAWKAAQYLIRALNLRGESGAASLLRDLGGVAETARDIAYRLYKICEDRNWSKDAMTYNGLVLAWPEITKLARQAPARVHEQQGLFE